MKTPPSRSKADASAGIHRIRFTQSGGYGGLRRGCEVAAEDLDADDRLALQHALQARTKNDGRRPALSEVSPSSPRDLLTYELELQTASGPRRLTFDDANAPEALRPLIARLLERSAPVPLP